MIKNSFLNSGVHCSLDQYEFKEWYLWLQHNLNSSSLSWTVTEFILNFSLNFYNLKIVVLERTKNNIYFSLLTSLNHPLPFPYIARLLTSTYRALPPFPYIARLLTPHTQPSPHLPIHCPPPYPHIPSPPPHPSFDTKSLILKHFY